ncbi:hypothetical protein OTERR_25900 [Oryzomicrobium terrae]|uniref:Uncharacterized protein n=1 Tax=Oryzomicrobium terrae TaxID=1735038 RepID=A0A5C1EB32_9RHOO|nr:hypothetical protein [Oryzomicrobium terrae]QEL66066.1 hypothetical protein OTERR_25900 [Oryzomicrobium terrae]
MSSVLRTTALAAALAILGAGCASKTAKPDEATKPAQEAAPAAAAAPTLPPCPAPAKVTDKKGKTTGKSSKTKAAPAPAPTDCTPADGSAPAAKTAPAPAAEPAPAPAAGKDGPGMKNGLVVDSSKVESGYGQKVKGINDWEGEITGRPAAGSKFTQLKIGMSMSQVTYQIGQPTDQGAYITGKAWIPFYFGSDRHRYELVYKGQGRLIFAGGAGFTGDWGSGHLIWIIHNSGEGCCR